MSKKKLAEETVIIEGDKETLKYDVSYHFLLPYGKYKFRLYLWNNYEKEDNKVPARAVFYIDDDHWNAQEWEMSQWTAVEATLSSVINVNWYNDAFDGTIKTITKIGWLAKWKFTYEYIGEPEPFILPTTLASDGYELGKQFPYNVLMPTGKYTFLLKVWNNTNKLWSNIDSDVEPYLAWFYVGDKHWDFGRWHVGGRWTYIYHGISRSELTLEGKPGGEPGKRHPKNDPQFDGYISPLRLAPAGQWEFSYILTSNLPKDNVPSPPFPGESEEIPKGEQTIVEGNGESLQFNIPYHFTLPYGKYKFTLYVWNNYDDAEDPQPARAIFNIEDDHWKGEEWELSPGAIIEASLSSELNINWYNNAFDGVIKKSTHLGIYARWKFVYEYVEEVEPFVLPKQLVYEKGGVDINFSYHEYITEGYYAFFIKVWNNIDENGFDKAAWFYVNDNHWTFGRWHVGGTGTYHGLEKATVKITEEKGKDNSNFEGDITPLRLSIKARWEFAYIHVSDIPNYELPVPPVSELPPALPDENIVIEGNKKKLESNPRYHLILPDGKYEFTFYIWDNYKNAERTEIADAFVNISDDHLDEEKWEISAEPIAEGHSSKIININWYNDAFDGFIKSNSPLGLYAKWRLVYKYVDVADDYVRPIELTKGGCEIDAHFPYQAKLEPGKYTFFIKVYRNFEDESAFLAWFYVGDNHWTFGRWHVGGKLTYIYHGFAQAEVEITDEEGKDNTIFDGYISPLRLAPRGQWEFAYIESDDNGIPKEPTEPEPDLPEDPPEGEEDYIRIGDGNKNDRFLVQDLENRKIIGGIDDTGQIWGLQYRIKNKHGEWITLKKYVLDTVKGEPNPKKPSKE